MPNSPKTSKKYAKDYYDLKKRKREHDSHIKRVSRMARYRATITTPQRKAYDILIEKWYRVKLEQEIKHWASFYLIDLFLPDYDMCIEIDGSSHDNPEIQKTDKIRDQYLKECGYWVFRIKNEEVNVWFHQRIKKSIKTRQFLIDTYWGINKNLR